MRGGGHCGNVTRERDELLFERMALTAELGGVGGGSERNREAV